MSVSGYGVVMLDQDSNIIWEKLVEPGSRIYGLDYNPLNDRVLVGFSDGITEVDVSTRESVRGIRRPSYNGAYIHSAFYHGVDEVIISVTQEDCFEIISFQHGLLNKWCADEVYERPDHIPEGSNWTHINFVQRYNGRYYVSMYKHPYAYSKPNASDGIIVVLDNDFRFLYEITNHVSKPHYVYAPYQDRILVANTGTGHNTLYNEYGELIWSINTEVGTKIKLDDIKQFKNIKHSIGPHVSMYSKDEKQLFTLIPNLREARLIDVETMVILHTWKLPEHVYGDSKLGEDPRPYQAMLLGDYF